MNRRRFLQAAGTLGAFSVAGCVSSGPGSGDTPSETDTPTDTHVDGEEPPALTDTTIRTLSADCRTSDAAETATVTVDHDAQTVTVTGRLFTSNPCHEATLADATHDPDANALDVTVTPAATDEVCVECVGVVEYEVVATFQGGAASTVTVSHDGHVVARTEPESSPSPGGQQVRDSALTVTGRRTADEAETATVSVEPASNRVVVEGTIQGSDGCKTAVLEGATYDRERDTLTVAVVTRDRETDGTPACTQAVVAIDYRATVTLTQALPGTVTVTHDGSQVTTVDGDDATVTTETY